ncbi:type IV secretory system conjugative DNA transfer family protein, partial [Candidatus Peregrinibacteria bacterium]|nr:type IV secretory system conjugative DNA transfer family protein [Candidatus Peregrinibacteria bacterium]
LMDDPEGGSLTDIVRLFTDDDYQRLKVGKVKNPIVKSFWVHQMAKTGAREKQEMIPYFAAKFGAFVTNAMMRNIIGQTKSAFDFFKVMQEGKILLMNLAKGETGEINSRLLGLIIVSKLQMAALQRQKVEKKDRRDFFLYIDEFQNYVTESIEVILSEARKYRLGLNIAHQYLAQLEGNDAKKGSKKVSLKDAVFGNVGSIMCYKIGAQDAEYMGKEMAPVFTDQDLINLDKFKACIKLSIDGQPSRPFSITPVNPYTEEGDRNLAEALKQLSRLKYGRPKEYVGREIIRRIGADV